MLALAEAGPDTGRRPERMLVEAGVHLPGLMAGAFLTFRQNLLYFFISRRDALPRRTGGCDRI